MPSKNNPWGWPQILEETSASRDKIIRLPLTPRKDKVIPTAAESRWELEYKGRCDMCQNEIPFALILPGVQFGAVCSGYMCLDCLTQPVMATRAKRVMGSWSVTTSEGRGRVLKPKSYIGVDFDGTCVTHEFPRVGRDIGAQPVLKRLVAEGHKLILFTMCSDVPAMGLHPLKLALQWFENNDIPLFGINRNPTQSKWSTSPKAYAHVYIDDAALGAPLCHGRGGERPFIDWVAVERMLFGPHD